MYRGSLFLAKFLKNEPHSRLTKSRYLALIERRNLSSNRNNFLTSPRPSHGSRQQNHHRKIPTYVLVTAGGTVFLIGSTYYAFLDRVPLTNRQRWIATDMTMEQELGDLEYQKLLQKFRATILRPNHRATKTVQRVGNRISAAAREFMEQHHKATNTPTRNLSLFARPYTFTVIQSDMANAFCLPGNHVFVMTGLFKYARTEDELAAIMGHEIAHNLARHAGEKMSGGIVVNILARMTLLFDPTGMLALMLLPAATVFRELPHSRVQELEADQIGVHLAALACYDPRSSKRVFQRMKDGLDGEGASPPEFLSTHPSHSSRIVTSTCRRSWISLRIMKGASLFVNKWSEHDRQLLGMHCVASARWWKELDGVICRLTQAEQYKMHLHRHKPLANYGRS